MVIFTFKTRKGWNADITRRLKTELEARSVDLEATIDTPEGPQPRFRWLTWGQETATNSCAYCRNVILAGVLHRSEVDLAGAFTAETGGASRIFGREIRQLVLSECAHSIYQALSRGHARVVENGEAGAMNVWLVHSDATLELTLKQEAKGIHWQYWSAQKEDSGVVKVAQEIVKFLSKLPTTTEVISFKKLRTEGGFLEVADRTFARARERAEAVLIFETEAGAWGVNGRSFVRTA